jgi:hypothetical protein
MLAGGTLRAFQIAEIAGLDDREMRIARNTLPPEFEMKLVPAPVGKLPQTEVPAPLTQSFE